MKKKENKTDSNTINNSPVMLALKMEEGNWETRNTCSPLKQKIPASCQPARKG